MFFQLIPHFQILIISWWLLVVGTCVLSNSVLFLCSGIVKKQNDGARLIIAATAGIIVGYLIGVNFPYVSLTKIDLSSSIYLSSDKTSKENQSKAFEHNFPENIGSVHTPIAPQIYVPTNPRGAESLPPGIIVAETDLYMRRLWGKPSEDLKNKPRYLVTFTVGWDQRDNIDAAVKKVIFTTWSLFMFIGCYGLMVILLIENTEL
ncbi:uncharacterized protein LOC143549574 [Bidens hawaiensis]|uniref:uncharacterized protein LOC143549574 n=1 Tax=Bidens hawaiensis TaxID=980011 RepID=UPI0040498E53